MASVKDTYNGEGWQKSLTHFVGSDMHNGADFRSRIFATPALIVGGIFSYGCFRTSYINRRPGLAVFGLAYIAAFGSAASLIEDRAGNMGSDYAALASLWTFTETMLIRRRLRLIPGAPSKREGYPFSLDTMAAIAGASSLFYIAYSTLLRLRPTKDQLVSRWGPRHKPNIGDD